MLISCKCLNFIATSPQQQQLPVTSTSSLTAQQKNAHAATTADAANATTTTLPPATPAAINAFSNDNNNALNIAASLMQYFLQKYPRNFIFYSQCMDFFKQAIGPIPDLTINAINQRDLIYSLTLNVPGRLFHQSEESQIWQLSFCINCNTALCAKRIQCQPTQFLINCALLTTNEELSQRRADRSFSDTFGVLIMDHPELIERAATLSASSSTLSIGSLLASVGPLDNKQLRLRQLQAQQQARLKREIDETEERIQRYSEQQFALLKSFREKSNQEYELLARLIQQVPDDQANGVLLDSALPALEVNGGAINYASVTRRRNTISSRRELMNGGSAATAVTLPTTPTTIVAQPPNYLALPVAANSVTAVTTSSVNTTSAIETKSIKPNHQQQQQTQQQTLPNYVATSGIVRKMSNFDTPPTTPEATPMSVGNSPTFRTQQQTQPQTPHSNFPRYNLVTNTTATFQQQFPTPTADIADDCLFELEDVEPPPTSIVPPAAQYYGLRANNQHMSPAQYQRLQSQHEHQMSDVDENDAAEEAEDALDLNSSMPIGMKAGGQHTNPEQLLDFAKSLPIEIANSPMAERHYVALDAEPDDLDIAASIKALAKSVHGEAVFGDLPRPRLRSQI